MLREIELGREADTYIRELLAIGNSLSKELLKFEIERGRTTAVVPEGVSAEYAVTHLRSGGLLNPRESRSYLISGLEDYLQKRADACVLFDDWESRPEDWTSQQPRSRSRIVFLNNEVYHCLTPEEASRDIVEECILWTARMPLIGALSRGSVPNANVSRFEVEQLLDIARSSVQIVVGAFDWEGYLFWSRPDSVPRHV